MVAATVETGIEESGDSIWRPPYTVDTLFELPETDHRYEVLRDGLLLAEGSTTLACVDREGELQHLPESLMDRAE